MSDKTELLPCPFCGSTNIDPAEWSGNDGKSGPGCGDCGALAESVADWNRRATIQPAAGSEHDFDSDGVCRRCCAYSSKAHLPCVAPVAPADAVRGARNDFERGYFCAVSVALREDGPVTTVRSMFSQGGDANKADPFDIDLFIEHGLMTSTPKEPAK